MKKILFIVSSLIFAFVFSSCNAVVLNPEDLMQPPFFSEEQREIYAALNETIGTDFLLQYPTHGENRSAIILRDLDGDRKSEALVMYKEDENSATRINVLSQTQDGWRSLCDVAGYEGDVYEILFSNISDTDEISVLVGFDQTVSSTKTMLVYNFSDKRLMPIYIRDYSALAVADVNVDNQNELVVINNNFSTRKSSANVLTVKEGNMKTLTQAPMNEDVLEYLSLKFGKMSNGSDALFIDSKLSSGSIITEVLMYDNGNLINFSYGYESLLSDSTMRQSEIECEDINNDGIIEIPSVLDVETLNEDSIPLTLWQTFDGRQLEKVATSADNLNYGYRIMLPDKWLGNNVIIKEVISNNEWRFVGYSVQDRNYSETLLSIRVYAADEIIDASSLSGYTKFLENTTHAYYAYFADDVGDEYKITLAELENSFSLIK